MAEREPIGSSGERPSFVESIDRGRRVGVLEDDTWMVGWQQPGGKILWHHHSDVWRVFRQNTRVISKFLGIPIDVGEVEEATSDPSIGISLPQLQEALIIPGEAQKAQELARSITSLMTLAINERTPASIFADKINSLRERLSPIVRNPHKVQTRQRLIEAETAERVADAQTATMDALASILSRAHESVSISGTLFRRAGEILEWVDKQERQIERLKNAVGAALLEIRVAKAKGIPVGPNSTEAWKDRFGGQTDILASTFRIRGNPYAAVVRRSEIIRLGSLREIIDAGNISLVEQRLSEAYPILYQVVRDREDREASGLYERYRSKGQ